MGKQLVGRDNVEQYICHKERKLYVDQTIILTPGAKDHLREKGIMLVYGTQPAVTQKSAPTSAPEPKNDLNGTIRTILQRDYAITDSVQASEITRKVLSRLEE